MRLATVAGFTVLALLISAAPASGGQGWSCAAESTVALIVAPGNQWNVQLAPA